MNNKELYDLKADPGETSNIIDKHPDVVANLRAAYDQWWSDVQPLLVNEAVTNAPKELYWKQFGGGPDEKMLRKMNPTKGDGGEEDAAPNRREQRNKRRDGAAKSTNE
ncbi:MAG: hypothetical protein NTY53_12915 [Kiritimatiellaeota bacterium]|nr:hypothetical protein [Kiritimatiellota bacterium]